MKLLVGVSNSDLSIFFGRRGLITKQELLSNTESLYKKNPTYFCDVSALHHTLLLHQEQFLKVLKLY